MPDAVHQTKMHMTGTEVRHGTLDHGSQPARRMVVRLAAVFFSVDVQMQRGKTQVRWGGPEARAQT